MSIFQSALERKLKNEIPRIKLIIFVAAAFLLIEVGLIGGWSSPYLVQLMDSDSSFVLAAEEGSWVASLMNFGRIFGSVVGALACQMLGSKMSNLLSIVPACICWVLMIFADAAIWLYAARTCGGVTVGMAFACFPLYLGEISSPKIRGALVAMAVIGAPVGNALVSLIGSLLNIRQSSIVFLIGSLLLILFFMWLPESPHHLIRTSKTQRARDSILWYDRECDVELEFVAIEKFVVSSNARTFRECLGEFRRPEMQRATFIILALFTFMQMSGLNNVIFYMATILSHAKVSIIDPSMCAFVIMCFGVVSAFVSVSLIDRLGRRWLLIGSSLTVAVAFICLEIHFTLIETGYNSGSLQWLPITSLTVAEIAICLGLVLVPSTVLSELFPANIKYIASCGANVVSGILGFLCSKTYQPLIDLMGERYVYWIYIIIELMAAPFALFIMPETKGKSLQQIQNDLMLKKSTDKPTETAQS